VGAEVCVDDCGKYRSDGIRSLDRPVSSESCKESNTQQTQLSSNVYSATCFGPRGHPQTEIALKVHKVYIHDLMEGLRSEFA
jgi:hypothetical protein